MIVSGDGISTCMNHRDQSVYVLSQWEMALHCNAISHWLGTYTDTEWNIMITQGVMHACIPNLNHRSNHTLLSWFSFEWPNQCADLAWLYGMLILVIRRTNIHCDKLQFRKIKRYRTVSNESMLLMENVIPYIESFSVHWLMRPGHFQWYLFLWVQCDNDSGLVQVIIAWHWASDEPLTEPIMFNSSPPGVLDKMAAISQTIFSDVFSCMKSFVFWLFQVYSQGSNWQ